MNHLYEQLANTIIRIWLLDIDSSEKYRLVELAKTKYREKLLLLIQQNDKQ